MSATCATCSAPTDTHLCSTCVSSLVRELCTVPWLYRQLQITLTRQARTGDRNGPRSSERPLPFDLGASVDLDALAGTLIVWCAAVAHRRGVAPPAGDPGRLARWLTLWPAELATHPDGAQLLDELLAVIASARRTIDRHADLRFVGPCDDCGADLLAGLRSREVTCRTDACGAVYPVEARRAWLLEQAVDQLRTARQLADELPWIAGVQVTDKRIGMWAKRGKLTPYLPHPADVDQVRRFRVGEVIDLARTMATGTAERAAAVA